MHQEEEKGCDVCRVLLHLVFAQYVRMSTRPTAQTACTVQTLLPDRGTSCAAISTAVPVSYVE